MEDVLILREPLHVLLNVALEPPAEERFALYEADLYRLSPSTHAQILMELDNLEDARQVCVCFIFVTFVSFFFNTFLSSLSFQFINVGQRIFAHVGRTRAYVEGTHRAYMLQHLPLLRFFFSTLFSFLSVYLFI
jgi:hypothetical protein